MPDFHKSRFEKTDSIGRSAPCAVHDGFFWAISLFHQQSKINNLSVVASAKSDHHPGIRSWVSIFHRKGAEIAKERKALIVGR